MAAFKIKEREIKNTEWSEPIKEFTIINAAGKIVAVVRSREHAERMAKDMEEKSVN